MRKTLIVEDAQRVGDQECPDAANRDLRGPTAFTLDAGRNGGDVRRISHKGLDEASRN
jgi:hypothetical protein